MSKELKSTIAHTLELIVVLGIAYVAVNVFEVKSELVTGIVIAALGAAAKYARVSDACPTPDYVNK